MIALYYALAGRSTGCILEYVSTQNILHNFCLTSSTQLFNQYGNWKIIYFFYFFLTRWGLTYPEVSLKVCHDSFCQLGNSVSLPWVIYWEAFYLHVVSSSSFIPVICPKLVVFLIPSQFVYLFCNLSKCILLFFSYISTNGPTPWQIYDDDDHHHHHNS